MPECVAARLLPSCPLPFWIVATCAFCTRQKYALNLAYHLLSGPVSVVKGERDAEDRCTDPRYWLLEPVNLGSFRRNTTLYLRMLLG